MNIIVLMTIGFAVAVGAHGFKKMSSEDNPVTNDTFIWSGPCRQKSHHSAYKHFVVRHILKQCFNRRSKAEWEKYLRQANLCGRARVQSFIDADEYEVQKICRGGGWRVRGACGPRRNMCISKSNMKIYNVESTKHCGCTVESVILKVHKVVVGCNKIHHNCFPVQYEKFNSQKPHYKICR